MMTKQIFICPSISIGLLIKYCSNVCQNPTMTQEQKRKQIIILLNSGISCITKISRDTGVSRLTVYRVKKRFDEKVPIQHKKGAGRPTIIRNRIGYSCARDVQNDKQKPVREIAAEISQKPDLKVSKSTVHRCLTSMGYKNPMLRSVPMQRGRMDCTPNPNPVHNPSHPEIELHIQAISIISQNIKSIKYPCIHISCMDIWIYGYFVDIWIYGFFDIWIYGSIYPSYGFMDYGLDLD